MKNSLLAVFAILGFFNCCSIFAQQKNKYELELNQFEKELEYKKITPTYKIQVESDTVRFEDFFISFSKLEEPLMIKINNDSIFVNEMITQNNVETHKIQVDYSNAVSLIQYYSYYDILMLQTYFYPCSGLGCGVNFQILYHTKTKKTFAFGRFRTGFEMELYNYNDNKPYYLSKSYDGRNIEEINKITYELFPVDFSLQELFPLKNVFAELISHDYEEIISFKKQWVD